MGKPQVYTVDGIKVKVDVDRMGKWSVAEAINRIQEGDNFAMVQLYKLVLGDQADMVLAELDPEGDPDVGKVMDWFGNLMAAMGEDGAKGKK